MIRPKLYANLKAGVDPSNVEGAFARLAEIESAELDGNSLIMSIAMDSQPGEARTMAEYDLFGEDVYRPFLEEMGVDSADSLEGKKLIAYMDDQRVRGLQAHL